MKVTTSVSMQDYFTALEGSAQKIEYHYGEIVAMAGIQPNHAKIHATILGRLFPCLEAKG